MIFKYAQFSRANPIAHIVIVCSYFVIFFGLSAIVLSQNNLPLLGVMAISILICPFFAAASKIKRQFPE